MPRMSKKRKEEWAFFLNEQPYHLTILFAASAAAPASRVSGYDHRVPAVSLQAGEAMKPDNTQETIYVGLDTGLPPYLPYPRFLLKMDISQTAKLLYALLLDRTTLSQRNGWQDDQGRTFIVYPIAEIAEMLDKGQTAIKAALNELDAAGLLERKRAGFSAANRLYVKLPPQFGFPTL